MTKHLEDKFLKLSQQLEGYGTLAVAYSGGVDSTLLLGVAADVLGNRVIAVTIQSAFHPEHEVEFAREFAARRNIRHVLHPVDLLQWPEIKANPPDRCYHCKQRVFDLVFATARKAGVRWVAHGANVDDLGDYRPGMTAAREREVVAPLIDAGLTKSEIRRLSRQIKIPGWDRPAMACYATRFPFRTTLTVDNLTQVAAAENRLAEWGFTGHRVRHHGPMARLELTEADLSRLIEPGLRSQVVAALKDIGFEFVTLDLAGYVTGSMNRVNSH